jgi:predicted dehydrogenase
MKKLNLAMVGCGESANDFALVSRLIPQVRLAAACDVDAERSQAFAKRNRIPAVFTDYSELLGLDQVDAVCLATPHDLHYEMILSAVQAKKHVLSEKPVTRTLAEAQKLFPQIKDVKVGVNFQYRYDIGCYAMARAVQAGALGKVYSVRINIPWHRTQAYFEDAEWHKTIARAGGGTLITQASHFLDIALWALGEKPMFAIGYAETRGFEVEVDTLTHAIVETENGTLISLTSSMVASSEQSVTIVMYGDQGTAFYNEKPFPRVRFKDVRVKKQRPPVWGVHAYQRSLAGFAKWVLEDEPFLIPAEETMAVLAAIDGIYRSARSGQREAIEVLIE